MSTTRPDHLASEEALFDFLTAPSLTLIETLGRLEGDVMILGAGGRLGPVAAVLAHRAAEAAGVRKQILAVSRFRRPDVRNHLEQNGVETIACDLLDVRAVQCLPQTENVLFLAEERVTAPGDEPHAWATNTLLPGPVGERLRESRIVVFSSAWVYPAVHSETGGCTEAIPPDPGDEYAQSCLGRERIFEYVSAKYGTRLCLCRFCHVADVRYGLLHHLATCVREGKPVERDEPCFNVLWSGDACTMALQALEHCRAPTAILNLTGPELLTVEAVVGEFAARLRRPTRFAAPPGETSHLANASRALSLFGMPAVTADQMVQWTATWLQNDMPARTRPSPLESWRS